MIYHVFVLGNSDIAHILLFADDAKKFFKIKTVTDQITLQLILNNFFYGVRKIIYL